MQVRFYNVSATTNQKMWGEAGVQPESCETALNDGSFQIQIISISLIIYGENATF